MDDRNINEISIGNSGNGDNNDGNTNNINNTHNEATREIELVRAELTTELVHMVLFPVHTFEDYYEVRKLVRNNEMSVNTILRLSTEQCEKYFHKDAPSGMKITLLQLAMHLHDNHFIGELLDKDVDITLRVENSELPLMTAILLRQLSMVEEMLTAGADPDRCSDVPINGQTYFYTPVELAVTKNEPEILDLLISRGGMINVSNLVTGISALYLAAQHSSYRAMETLLSWDADVDKAVDVKGRILTVTETALSVVIKKGLNVNAVRQMVKNLRMDINFVDSMNFSYLHYAVFLSRNPEMVACLLDAGIEISVPDGDGMLPVEYKDPDNETCEQSVDIIRRHIVKMIVADFNMCPRNMVGIHGIDFGNFPIHSYNEVQLMKSYHFYGTTLTCYNLLHSSLLEASTILENADVTELYDEEISRKFPIYAGMINYRLDRARRHSLGHYS